MEVTIRDANPDDVPGIARVHVDSWRSTYRGIVPDEVLDNLSYAQREEMWGRIFQNHLPGSTFLVAVDETGRIVGFADAGPSRESELDSELYAIYLLEEAQGQGIGRRLFEEIMRRLRRAGFKSMTLWVLEDNPARRFYERMGGRQAREQVITIGKELPQIGYDWDVELSIREGPGD
jgi:ribosomal protein S18 acetylase RimI-like enzyme